MFDSLHTKLENAFKKIIGHGVLSAKEIEAAMKEVRMALLEADVNFKVVKEFSDSVSQKALGEDVLKSLSPGQQVIKLVHDELVRMMGESAVPLNLAVAPPAVIMLVGLQGSGKTTTAHKLALLLKTEFKRKPLLVSVDVYRPAAMDQLKVLGKQINVEVYPSDPSQKPEAIVEQAVKYAPLHGFDSVIIDTAGRLQIDQALMDEIKSIKELTKPHEILLVADCMTGQEAVNVALGFHQAVQITGLILTKLDGDARGGAALSMRAVTGMPIKFVGISEKSDGLEVFHPDRMASRILGMGDVLTLIEKASRQISVEDTLDMQKKFKKNQFSLEDFLQQMGMMKKMGSITSLMGMIPGINKLVKEVDEGKVEKEMKHVEAIILSMTKKERANPAILDGSRRRRIAKGSGRNVEEVNRLLKQFAEMKKMMGSISKMGMRGLGGLLSGRGLR